MSRRSPQADHTAVVEQLRAQRGVWLPVKEYRTRATAEVVVTAIHTGRWVGKGASPYTPGDFEARTEMTEFGFRVDARFLGTKQQRQVDAFNARYPVGTPVLAYPGFRPEDDRNATRLVTRTRSVATVLSGHTAVVWVDGHSACIALTHIDPQTTPTVQEAA